MFLPSASLPDPRNLSQKPPADFSHVILAKIVPHAYSWTCCWQRKWTGHDWLVVFHQKGTLSGDILEIGGI